MSDSTFITRVVLHNYKSIAACDVRLGPLTFLVGPNGSGKSNFLDALRLVGDALRTGLDQALRARGGPDEVLRRTVDMQHLFGMRLEFRLPSGMSGHYAFEIDVRSFGGYEVLDEECVVRQAGVEGEAYYRVRGGEVSSSAAVTPAVAKDRLYLVNASGLPEFRPIYDAFMGMGFYNLSPEQIGEIQAPGQDELLASDGRNLASVLRRIEARDLPTKLRIEKYLGLITPGVQHVRSRSFGTRESVELEQSPPGSTQAWWFPGASMSDGTLRALGILVALFQGRNGAASRLTLVGIEEPETALHPAAAGILRAGLQEASETVQVLVTSHSGDLLDTDELDPKTILAVVLDGGETRIGPLDRVGRSVLRDRLFTAGELLRLSQLQPSGQGRKAASGKRDRLFDLGVT